MDFQDIILEVSGGVATITLNRPETLNSLGGKLLDELSQALQTIREDDEIRVMVLTGAGRGFCSGADVSGMGQIASGDGPKAPGRRKRLTPAGWFGVEISQVEKPTIAAINGAAVGGGLALAMACDVRIASDKARLGAVWAHRYGLVPEGGCSYFLPRIVGLAKALEILYLGDILDAEESARIGLVNKVVPHDDLMKVTEDIATKIAGGGPMGLELTKRLIYRGVDAPDLVSQIELEGEYIGRCLKSEDFKEGIRAFVEKRPPDFKGI